MFFKTDKTHIVREAEDIYNIMQHILARHEKLDMSKEHFWTVALSPASVIVNIELVFIGSFRKVMVDPPEVFSVPLQKKADSLILIHNHPSGSLKPSETDLETTDRLIKVGEICKIEVRDHVILTPHSYFSFADAGLIESLKWSTKYALSFLYEKQVLKYKEGVKQQLSKKDALLKQQKEKLDRETRQGEERGAKRREKEIARQMLEAGAGVSQIKQWTGLNATQIGKIRSELLTKGEIGQNAPKL